MRDIEADVRAALALPADECERALTVVSHALADEGWSAEDIYEAHSAVLKRMHDSLPHDVYEPLWEKYAEHLDRVVGWAPPIFPDDPDESP